MRYAVVTIIIVKIGTHRQRARERKKRGKTSRGNGNAMNKQNGRSISLVYSLL